MATGHTIDGLHLTATTCTDDNKNSFFCHLKLTQPLLFVHDEISCYCQPDRQHTYYLELEDNKTQNAHIKKNKPISALWQTKETYKIIVKMLLMPN